jgi:recombination protein RecA
VAKGFSGEVGNVIDDVTKRFGTHVITRASMRPPFRHVRTGVFVIDLATNGGVPVGLTTMLVGWEASGKTTLAQRVVAGFQRKYPDKTAIYLDIEGTYDPVWGAVHGIDNERMALVQPESGEQAVDLAKTLLRAENTSLVVLDSLAMLTPMKEMEGSAEDSNPGIQSRLIGRMVRECSQTMLDERKRGHFPTLLMINQWRNKIGVIRGDPRVLPGGHALKFVPALTIETLSKVKLGRDEHELEVADVNEMAFRIKKSKLGNSIMSGEYIMTRNPAHRLGQGAIDDAATVVSYAKRFGIVAGGGSSWRLDGLDMKFGRLSAITDHLYTDPELFEALKRRILIMHREAMELATEEWD